MPCPQVNDVNAAVHDPECSNPTCDNGYLQVMPREVWGYFNNDQLNKLFEVQGEYNQNVAVITFAAVYTDGTEADFQPFDRIEMVGDYSKRVSELFEASPTGVDRLRYRVLDVEQLVSSDGVTYEQNKHFIIERGRIHWISNVRPKYDQATQRGEVCSVSYTIPVRYYIHHVMREIRGTQRLDPTTGEKVAIRLPQHCLVSREFLFPDDNDDVGLSTSKFPRRGLRTPG
jgi:hypothetical protein